MVNEAFERVTAARLRSRSPACSRGLTGRGHCRASSLRIPAKGDGCDTGEHGSVLRRRYRIASCRACGWHGPPPAAVRAGTTGRDLRRLLSTATFSKARAAAETSEK
jgi:hypothetical protein